MKKTDEILQTYGANLGESVGVGVTPGQAPPGLSADQTQRMPERLRGVARNKTANDIPVEKIERDPGQPREEFDEEALARLADSLRIRGQLQPVRVYWDEAAAKYRLIAGERRWRAAKMAGLPTLTCIVHETQPEPGEVRAIQLIENLVREDLKPVEQARAFKQLMHANDWSTRQLAAELNVSQSAVMRALALLELPNAVQERVERGELPATTAAEIASLGDADAQIELAEQAVTAALTRADVVEAVKARKVGHKAERPAKVDLKLGDGHKLTLVGPAAAAGSGALVEVLRRFIKKIQAEAKSGSGHGEAA